MDRNAAVTRIRRYMGFNERLSADFIVDALKDAQEQLEAQATLPWFLRVFEHPLVTAADDDTVDLPADFLRDTDDGALYVINASGSPIRSEVKKSPYYQEIDPNADGVAEGKPKYYRLEVTELRLYPTPDAVYNLRLNYFKTDDVLTSNTENLWLKYAPNLLVGFAGQLCCIANKDENSLATFNELRSRAEADLTRETIARQETGVQYQMGGPH